MAYWEDEPPGSKAFQIEVHGESDGTLPRYRHYRQQCGYDANVIAEFLRSGREINQIELPRTAIVARKSVGGGKLNPV